MKTVNVRKDKLLEALEENKQKHAFEFKRLREKYLETLKKRLEAAISEIETGDMPILEIPQKPISHVNDYMQAIRMVSMSVDTTIELDNTDFARYVMDDWDWRHQFEMTKTVYGV